MSHTGKAMRMRRLSVSALPGWLLAVLAVSLATSSPIAEAEPTGAAILRGDPRLAAKLTVTVRDRPLGEVTAGLGRRLGVPLAASRDTANDKVTLFLDDRPAAEVLELIARHFDFRWARRGKGYELGQSAASKQREAAQREAGLARQFAAIDAWMKRLASLVSTPVEQLQAREKEIDRQLDSPGIAGPEKESLEDERAAIEEIEDIAAPVAATLCAGLTASQRRQLRSRGLLRLSTADRTLPSRFAGPIHEAAVDQLPDRSTSWATLPAAGAAVEISLVESDNPPAGLRVRGELDLSLRFTLTSVRTDGERLWPWPVVWYSIYPGEDAEPAAPGPADPFLERIVELRLPPARGGTAVVPSRRLSIFAIQSGDPWPADLLTLSEVAEALHRAAGVEVVADSFLRARIAPDQVAGPSHCG